MSDDTENQRLRDEKALLVDALTAFVGNPNHRPVPYSTPGVETGVAETFICACCSHYWPCPHERALLALASVNENVQSPIREDLSWKGDDQ